MLASPTSGAPGVGTSCCGSLFESRDLLIRYCLDAGSVHVPRFDDDDDTLKQLGWKQIDIPAEEVTRRTPFAQCRLIGGVLEAECDQLFRRVMGITGEGIS